MDMLDSALSVRSLLRRGKKRREKERRGEGEEEKRHSEYSHGILLYTTLIVTRQNAQQIGLDFHAPTPISNRKYLRNAELSHIDSSASVVPVPSYVINERNLTTSNHRNDSLASRRDRVLYALLRARHGGGACLSAQFLL